jgi:hypothetical protein
MQPPDSCNIYYISITSDGLRGLKSGRGSAAVYAFLTMKRSFILALGKQEMATPYHSQTNSNQRRIKNGTVESRVLRSVERSNELLRGPLDETANRNWAT